MHLKSFKLFALCAALFTCAMEGTAFTYSNSQLGFSATLPDGLDDFSTNARVRVLVSRGKLNDGGLERLIAIQDLGGVIGREDLSKHAKKPADTTLEKTQWNSFDVDVFRVVERMNGLSLVTFQALVPLKPSAIQITVSGPAVDEHKLRTELQAVVASIEGSSNWSASGGVTGGAPRYNLIAIVIGVSVLLSGRFRIGRFYGLHGTGARIAGFVVIIVGVVLPMLMGFALPLLRPHGVNVTGLLIGWIVVSCAIVWTAIVILMRNYGNAYAKPRVETELAATATLSPKPAKALITHCRMCQEPVPIEQQGVAKTCSSCGADLSRW